MSGSLFRAGLVAVGLFVAGCEGTRGPGEGSGRSAAVAAEVGDGRGEPRFVTVGGARPASLEVPAGYDPKLPTPLVLVLHGYGGQGREHAAHLGYLDLPRRERVLVLTPDGTEDSSGRRFWNASDACCDFESRGVDDVAYLTGLVAEVGRRFSVDARRVYVVGHSNGGYMAHRLACEGADTFAAIVSLAGAAPDALAVCEPKQAVSVLQLHGDRDDVVLFEGGARVVGKGKGSYPGARTTVARAAVRNGCGSALVPSGQTFDLDASLSGQETRVARHACPKGLDAELWTIEGGGHMPKLTSEFADRTWRWLQAHPKR